MSEAPATADRTYPPGHSLAYDYLVGRITQAEYDAAVVAQADRFLDRHRSSLNRIAVNWFVAGVLFGLNVGVVLGVVLR